MATKEQVIAVMRTEEAYSYWVGRYYDFATRLPRDWRPERKAEAFLGWLAEVQRVAARTQNQAFAALLYLYRHVLGRPLREVDALRAKRPEQIREAPTLDEVRALLGALRDTPHVLRHGYASHSLEDPRTIQRVMGHAQLETTMGYIHRDVQRARSPLELVEVGMRSAECGGVS